jgi:hypothetical protein
MWLTVNGEVAPEELDREHDLRRADAGELPEPVHVAAPGDVISTGTPAGVGLGIKPEPVYLKVCDVVELGIDGLGRSRQKVAPSR